MYVAGYNASGQLGVGDERPRRSFVGLKDSVKTVISSGSANSASTFMITLSNKLMNWLKHKLQTRYWYSYSHK